MPRMSDAEYRDFLMTGTRTGKLATTRRDGRPHVVPVWFVMDGDDLVFTTSRQTVKGRSILRDGRVALCVDDERMPYAFVLIEGEATVAEDPGDLLDWTTCIARRYVGEEKADAYGKLNAVPEEMLVRLSPEKVVTETSTTRE